MDDKDFFVCQTMDLNLANKFLLDKAERHGGDPSTDQIYKGSSNTPAFGSYVMNGETMVLNREGSGDYINTTLCVFQL